MPRVLRPMVMRVATVLVVCLATTACADSRSTAASSPQVSASSQAPPSASQPKSEANCVGTVTASTDDGRSVVLRREGTATLDVSPGAVVTVVGDGRCGDAVRVGGDLPAGLKESKDSRVVVERSGRYVLRATHAMCAGLPDPSCRGGIAFDGTLVLTA